LTALHTSEMNIGTSDMLSGHGQIAAARLLIVVGADVNAKHAKGGTPLHVAASWNRRILCALLLANGADPNLKDENGKTPLAIAKEKDHKEIIELLKKHGAKE